MPLTLDRIMELVRKHDAIGAEIAKLDEQRAALDAERAAVKDELEGRKPGRRAITTPVVMATVTAASSAPPSTPQKAGRVEQELTELLPWLGAVQSDHRRKCIELRAAGKQPEEIARQLGLDNKAVGNAIYQGRLQMRSARQSGAKPKSAKSPASDSEDGPAAGAQPAELAAEPSIVHLWSPDSGGTPACGLPYDPAIRMSTKAGAATCSECRAAEAIAAASFVTPARPPDWVLRWLMPEVRRAYEQVALEAISMQTAAWFENVKPAVISGRVNGARSQINRLLRWEADREREGVPLTDKDKEPPERYSSAPGGAPLLAALASAPTESLVSEVDHVTTMSDVGADGRASAPSGSGTADDVGAAMASTSSRRDLADELQSLRPWFGLLGPKSRELVELRAGGMSPAAIAKQLQRNPNSVSAMLFDARASLRRHKARGSEPPRSAPAPLPPLPTECETIEDPSGRRPGEIDPDVDLSEFFAAEPDEPPVAAPPAPIDEDPNAELKALAEYFPALSPNQRFVVDGTLDGIPQEKMADRQGTSRHAIRTTLSMAIARLRSLRAQAAARGSSPAEVVDDAQPAIARLRRKHLRVLDDAGDPDARVRGATIAGGHLSLDEIRAGAEIEYPDDVDRPLTRAECLDMPRPCPFVSCRHHLYLDVNPQNGAIKLNFPHLEVWQMVESCSLDVADRDGVTLDHVGAILNLTRERIRQIEVRGLENIKRARKRGKFEVEDLPDGNNLSPLAAIQATG